MANPVPLVVANPGEISEAPPGAVPINLYGAGGSTATGTEIVSANGKVRAVAREDEIFRAEINTASGTGILRLLEVGGVLSCLLTDQDGDPLISDWSPAGVVVHQDLDLRAPEAPATGTYVLQSVNGAATWVQA